MQWITKGAAVITLSTFLLACSPNGAKNETVEKAFAKKFGQVDSVKWNHNSDYSYAHFVQDGKSVVAVFGNDGQYIETDLAKPLPE
ncbi:RNA-binding protein [Spirosoma gilvum]